MNSTVIIQNITIFAIPVIFAITLHEAAHGFAARYFGDNTAYMMGRLTLNPLKHIDPIWTIVVPLLTVAFTPFIFGGAKPVPVNFDALRNPRRDAILVAAAGPAANLLMMFLWALILRTLVPPGDSAAMEFLANVCAAGVYTNAIFMLFNLIPIPPLDGGRILEGLLPPKAAQVFSQIEPFGILLVLILMQSGGLFQQVFSPLVQLCQNAVYSLIGLS